MSAAARKNDPFHFDEIYKQAGVEDLFVKKTMGELKQKQPAGPAPSASPVRPAAGTPAPRPTTNAANFDLDFLATMATPGGMTQNLPKPNSSSNLPATASTSSWQQPQPQLASRLPPVKAPVSQKALDDPFALFEELPGAAPPQKHVATPAPVRLGTGGSDTLLDFDDSAGGPPAAAGPAAPSFSLLSPTGPPLRPAAPQAQPSAQPQPPPPPQAQPPPPPPSQQQQAPPAPATGAIPSRPLAPGAEAPAAGPPPPPPDYADHMQHRPAPPGPGDMPAGAAGRDPPISRGPIPPVVPGVAAADYHAQQAPHYLRAEQTSQTHPRANPPLPGSRGEELPYGPETSEPSNSSNPSFTWSHTSSGSGISGYLKAFGKKAVRAAKAGLAQLEQALEGIDQPTHGGQQQHYPQGGQRATSVYGAGQGKSDPDQPDVSNDEALAWAVRLADLPPHAQQQALAQMAPSLRRRVIEVLREQVRAEHAAVAPGASPAPAGAAADLGAGPGHSAARGAPAPPPPLNSQGTSRPASRPSSQDGGPPPGQQGSGPAGRPAPATATAAAPPPPYSDAVQQPAATAPPAPQSPQPPPAVPHTDLLGFGSGDLHSSPGVAAPVAAATAPVAPKSAPVVDDLLGFGDGGTPSAARPSGAPPTAAPSSARAAAPATHAAAAPAAAAAAAAVAPPPQVAAVHVDDMDDFFSGGGKAVPAPSAGSASMHGSCSAPNLGTVRAAGGGGGIGGGVGGGGVGNSSSAAALADMLHGSDEEGGADVDVSGYAELYKGEAGAADEPELRRRLRAQREAAKHAKMKAALAEKLAKDVEEMARREQQVALKDQYKADIEAWKNKNKGNIRGLLGSLHTVLWADSGWTPVSVGDVLDPVQVKKVYMRANLLVHPDKVRQRNGTAEQVAIADMVFDTLKDAWNAFR